LNQQLAWTFIVFNNQPSNLFTEKQVTTLPEKLENKFQTGTTQGQNTSLKTK
jgi:hypothetical protein